MSHKLEDLIDIKLVQSLQDKLNVIYSFPSAIIDNDGKVLTAVAWQDICTKFHRINPESENECIKSDKYILEHLQEANPAVSYKCPHGLVDNATPIVIDGIHLGNFFTGQFYLDEKPDKQFFQQQAAKYGFDEKEYLEAVEKVPVWSRERLNQYLDFIKGFIEIIAGNGLKNLKEMESKNALEIANKKLLDEIEERKSAVELLRKSELRYRNLFDQANEGLLLLTMDGDIADLNYSFAMMHGYTVDELKSMNIKALDVLKEGTFEQRAEIINRLHNGEPVRFEVEHYHKNGHIVTINVTTSIISIDDQQFFLAFHQDITERKQTDILLKERSDEITEQNKKLYQTNLELSAAKGRAEENAERFNLAMKASNDGLFDWDLETNKIYYSPRWKEMLGYEDHELPNDFSVWEKTTDPEDVKKSWELQQKLITKQIDRFVMEFKMKHKDGHFVDILARAEVTFSADGKAVRMVGTHTDITERKLAEEMLKESELFARSTLDALSANIAILNENGVIIAVNRAWREFAEANSSGSPDLVYAGTNYLSVCKTSSGLHSEEASDMAAGIHAVMRGESTEFSLEYPCHSPSEKRWFNARVTRFSGTGPLRVVVAHENITERKKAEQALAHSHELMRYVIEHNQSAIAIHDKDMNYIYVSQRYLNDYKVKEKDVIGKNHYDVFPDLPQKWKDVHQKALTGVISSADNDSYLREDGTLEWTRWECRPWYEVDGSIGGIIVYTEVITERKKTEAKIREKDLQFRKLSSNVPDLIFQFTRSPDGTYSVPIASEGIKNIFGCTPEDVLNDFTPIGNVIYPEDKERVINDIEYSAKHLNYFTCEFRVQIPGKPIQWIYSRSSPEKLPDGSVTWYGFNTNITERKHTEEIVKENEEKYRILHESAAIGIGYYKTDGTIISYNKIAAANMNGKPEDFNGKSIYDIFPKTEADIYFNRIKISARSDAPFVYEDEISLPIGNKFFLSTISRITDSKNNVIGVQIISQDITDRKNAELELEKHRNHLEELVKVRTEELERTNELLKISVDKEKELNEMKSRFLSTTSHEFRTPLTSVLSSTELLQRFGSKWSDEKKDEHYNRIVTSIDYLTTLLDDILTLNRADSGKISFNPEKLNLQQFANECMLDANSLITDMHELKFNYKPKRKEFQLDPKLMRFVFNNLLSNAVKYSPKGGLVELNISTDKKHILIEVSDEGIGIPPEDVNKIFESFYRAKHTNNIAGTGLGLAIVKRAVDLHNGEISVKSELGKGTTVTVNIPIIPAT